jgi:hypothetical protein
MQRRAAQRRRTYRGQEQALGRGDVRGSNGSGELCCTRGGGACLFAMSWSCPEWWMESTDKMPTLAPSCTHDTSLFFLQTNQESAAPRTCGSLLCVLDLDMVGNVIVEGQSTGNRRYTSHHHHHGGSARLANSLPKNPAHHDLSPIPATA